MDLDLRRLRYFVEVADELSFVHAAAKLHMTQPALSRQIAALEKSWGVQLFARSRSGTNLTEAGATLLARARVLLSDAATFERDARLMGRAPARFVVGFMPGVDAGALIAAFRMLRPDVDVTPIFTSTTAQAPFLRDGRADVVFCRPPIRVDGAHVEDLFEEPVVAAVRHDHPLASRHWLQLADLDSLAEPVLQRPSANAGDDVFDPQDAVLAVSAGQAVALLPAGIAAFYVDASVRCIPVRDAPLQTVALAYNKNRIMPHIDAFTTLCREELGPRVRDLPRRLAVGERASGSAL
ncbi:LysR family transcriptional regulator [Mycobacterium sp. MS1601]|uniref:LysR family transcriptional regulator n=1 Tax=Mycobacterium sp. MS1601 TaxID=1936029 RepID=UPI00178CCDEA|nr:LysR family transcriptional regulator [Mycobacterium sp. MS1601]